MKSFTEMLTIFRRWAYRVMNGVHRDVRRGTARRRGRRRRRRVHDPTVPRAAAAQRREEQYLPSLRHAPRTLHRLHGTNEGVRRRDERTRRHVSRRDIRRRRQGGGGGSSGRRLRRHVHRRRRVLTRARRTRRGSRPRQSIRDIRNTPTNRRRKIGIHRTSDCRALSSAFPAKSSKAPAKFTLTHL